MQGRDGSVRRGPHARRFVTGQGRPGGGWATALAVTVSLAIPGTVAGGQSGPPAGGAAASPGDPPPRIQATEEARGPATGPAQEARSVVLRALDLMGGDAVAGLERIRLDMMTQWQRTSYREVPWTDRPSFEAHVDVRDYTIPAWRNTRDFGTRTLVNVVRDSVATTDLGTGPRPQSVAYVDERDELFAYTPDRLVLRLSRADDLRAMEDTLIGGEPHARVRGTVEPGIRVTVAFHLGTGLPTLLRFRRGHPNDFGLVPFGEMEVAVWYSRWRTFGSISIPTQWDIQRAGAPYKRMTVRNATLDPDFAPDSFAVSDELRRAFLADRRPMHDRPVDSVAVEAPGLVAVHSFGFPAGAVRVDDGWLLLQAGHAPLSLERALDALATEGVGAPTAALVASARPGNGGVAALVRDGVPVYTSAAAAPFLDVMLEGAGVRPRGITLVDRRRTVGQGDHTVVLEPLDLPDVPGSVVAWAPRLGWLYAPDAVTPLDVRLALERAEARGWDVELLGTARRLAMPR